MLERLLTRLIEWIVIAVAALIVTVVSVEVLLRYVFGETLYITEELTRYLMVWLVFLGTALAARDGTHIHITVVINKLPVRWRYVCKIVSHLLVILFCSILIIEGAKILPDQFEQTAVTIDVSMFWFYLAIPVGTLLVVIFVGPKIIQAYRGARGGGSVSEGPN